VLLFGNEARYCRPVRFRRVLAAAAAAVLAHTGTAAADTTWTRISPNFSSNIVEPSLAADGANVVAAWSFQAGPSDARLQAVTFRPSLSGDAVSLAGPVPVVTGWGGIGEAPQLFPKLGGGLQIAFEGFRSTTPGDPFAGKTAIAPRNADGSFGSPVVAGRPYTGLASAILLQDGTQMLSSSHTGNALVLRGVDPNQDGVDFSDQFGPGCCSYHARLERDAMSRVWLTWYSNQTGNTGLYVQQVNPQNAAPIGSPQRAPGSESSNNNSFRIPFACAVACRVVYGVDQRLVSWSPGETASTPVATIPPGQSAGRVVTAAYRSDGRLWVAWFDGTDYRFTLGDEKGAGGTALSAGHPTGPGSAYALNSIAVPEGLLLAANWLQGVGANSHAVWANVVTVPPPATPAPGPRDVELGYDKKRKRFLINVQYVLRDRSCRNPCPARAELRTRIGRRLYAVGALPGDGRVVLGARRGIKIPRGRKIFFYIPIKRAALLKVPFKTIRGYRYGETRLRVWLRTPQGEVLTVRDGRIRVSIARIKSGALPNLRGIL
jgi:hypothetical protein